MKVAVLADDSILTCPKKVVFKGTRKSESMMAIAPEIPEGAFLEWKLSMPAEVLAEERASLSQWCFWKGEKALAEERLRTSSIVSLELLHSGDNGYLAVPPSRYVVAN